MAEALVTGATGLLGSYVAERLLADGWTVRALVRDPARASWLATQGVALHTGDVLDAASLGAAAHGCDVIVHAAAAIFHAEGWAGYERSNVVGTDNVVEATRSSGARLVHVSSVAVYGPGSRYRPDGALTAEDAALQPIPRGANYARSKRESETRVPVREFFTLGAQGLDTRLRTVPVPGWLARGGATLVDRIAPLVGIDRSVTSARSSVDFISRNNPFTSERARSELGWSPSVSHEIGVPDAFAWWRRQG